MRATEGASKTQKSRDSPRADRSRPYSADTITRVTIVKKANTNELSCRKRRTKLWYLVGSGKLKPRESIAQGIEAAPEAFLGLLKGRNFGKQLVKLI